MSLAFNWFMLGMCDHLQLALEHQTITLCQVLQGFMFLGHVEELGGEVASSFTNAVNTTVVQVMKLWKLHSACLFIFELFGTCSHHERSLTKRMTTRNNFALLCGMHCHVHLNA